LRTDGSFKILLPFFQTSRGVGVLNSAIFNSFHNRVEFGTILEGLWNFGGGGGSTPPPLLVRRCSIWILVEDNLSARSMVDVRWSLYIRSSVLSEQHNVP